MMATSFFKLKLARFWRSRSKASAKGFTLLELLIVTLIAGGIVSGLLYLVVELLTADQRESSRNETQRDMQRSLDYISAELREAVYVYPGRCLGTAPQGTPDPNDDADPTRIYCPGLARFVPQMTSNGAIPVLAFWRQQRFPDAVIAGCARGTPVDNRVSCESGHSYALIVYSLTQANPNRTWSGRARITRYALTEFASNGSRNPGYVNPASASSFPNWPLADAGNLQVGTPPGTALPLTDFVDYTATAGNQVNLCPNDPAPGEEYSLSPAATVTNIRSFYACVSNVSSTDNQEVVLYLQGNAVGRPGINSNTTFLPALSTRVFSRGVLRKQPPQ